MDILRNSVVHFKQLRSLELSDVVIMRDFGLWEDLGTLPSLENLTLMASDPATHPKRAPPSENSNDRSSGPSYFEVLESLCVTGSFFLIQHILGFIDSPYLNSIKVYPIIGRHDLDADEDLVRRKIGRLTGPFEPVEMRYLPRLHQLPQHCRVE